MTPDSDMAALYGNRVIYDPADINGARRAEIVCRKDAEVNCPVGLVPVFTQKQENTIIAWWQWVATE